MHPDSAVHILDGGMGRELERMGAPFRQPEWSALALMEAPETVALAHENFIRAGAGIITTNTYALVPFHIGQKSFEKNGRRLAKLAGELARKTADDANKPVKVAGCIPPVFGSYKPENFNAEHAPSLLTPLIEEQDPFVDLWLTETLSSIKEALFVGEFLKGNDKPLWLSFTLTDNNNADAPATLRSGEDVHTAIETVVERTNAQAILFNCSQPEEMARALCIADTIVSKHKSNAALGVYANTFPPVKEESLANDEITPLRAELTPERYVDFARQWQKLGASIIGGCCGIGPEHIQALHQAFKS